MDIKEFAKKLDGREYASYPQFLQSEIDIAKENGWVIVYGSSDDLMEFDGAIYDEAGCFDGGKVYFDKNGVAEGEEEKPNMIAALWCVEDDICWTYKTDIPHETFMIYEDGEKYCRAIIFSIDNVK